MEFRRLVISLLLFICSGSASFAFAKIVDSPILLEKLVDLPLVGNEHLLLFGASSNDIKSLSQQLPGGKITQVQYGSEEKKITANNVKLLSLPEVLTVKEKYHYITIQEFLTRQPKQQMLLEMFADRLMPQGKMRLILPNYKQGQIAQSLVKTWVELQDNLHGSPLYVFHPPSKYQNIIARKGLKIKEQGMVKGIKKFPTQESFKVWLSQEWSYLKGIIPQDKELFLTTFLGNYLEETNQLQSAEITWEEEIYFLEAQRS